MAQCQVLFAKFTRDPESRGSPAPSQRRELALKTRCHKRGIALCSLKCHLLVKLSLRPANCVYPFLQELSARDLCPFIFAVFFLSALNEALNEGSWLETSAFFTLHSSHSDL